MRNLSPSEVACKGRSRLSISTLANFLKPTGVGVARGSGVFSSHGLLPRYSSQRASASEVRGGTVFGIVQEFVQKWAISLAGPNYLGQEENSCYLPIIPERQARIATWVRSAR